MKNTRPTFLNSSVHGRVRTTAQRNTLTSVKCLNGELVRNCFPYDEEEEMKMARREAHSGTARIISALRVQCALGALQEICSRRKEQAQGLSYVRRRTETNTDRYRCAFTGQ
ncbi:hypothetical protein TRVL_05337 [Trypanosoma vivax]|nr:hypothetical protein TRVL_05337 [Trypanosoma vivax]